MVIRLPPADKITCFVGTFVVSFILHGFFRNYLTSVANRALHCQGFFKRIDLAFDDIVLIILGRIVSFYINLVFNLPTRRKDSRIS